METTFFRNINNRNKTLLKWTEADIPIDPHFYEDNFNLIDIKSKSLSGKDIFIFYDHNLDPFNTPKIKIEYDTPNKDLKLLLKCLFEDNFKNNYSPAMTPCNIIISIVSIINTYEEKVKNRSKIFTNFLRNNTNIPDDIFDIIDNKL